MSAKEAMPFWLYLIGVAGAFCFVFAYSGCTCADVEAETGIPTKWSPVSGCYVLIGKQWVPVERWRQVQP